MSRVHFDQIAPPSDFDRLPIRFVGTASRASAVVRLLMLLPAMAVLIVPLMLVIAHASGETAGIGLISERPLSAAQILIGIAVWCALFFLPARDIVMRLGAERTVTIDGADVRVADRTPFATRSWSTPLASYKGIAHHVRASLSGLRHELILVHADPARNVLVAAADRIPQATLDRAKALLGLPEVPARSLYA
jgi:hypothetical protein